MHKLAVVASLVAVGMSAEAGTVLRGQHVASSGLAESLSYCVYLPDGYADGTERYPTLYLLHGFGAGDNEWLDRGSIADLLDRMIADGEIGPVIAVMPDAKKSWYVDSAALGGPGDYATAIQHDLVAEIDRLYRTIPRSAHRGIAGISMGGFGALRLAFSHPDEFGAVGALSAGLFMPGGVSWRNGPAGRRAEHLESWYADTFGAGFDVDLYKQSHRSAMWRNSRTSPTRRGCCSPPVTMTALAPTTELSRCSLPCARSGSSRSCASSTAGTAGVCGAGWSPGCCASSTRAGITGPAVFAPMRASHLP
jgi:enterochelin esterase family protein